MNTILVIAPHPDDEVLGVGGTLCRYIREGYKVHVCIVTKPKSPDWTRQYILQREREVKNVCSFLRISRVHHLDFPASRLDTVAKKDLAIGFSKLIALVKPQTVFIPSRSDLHHDHRVVFESSLVALRPFKSFVRRILSYETLSETEWGEQSFPFIPTVYIDISSFLPKKIKAMKLYKSELRKFPHPRSIGGMEHLAKKRGSEASMKAAEAFQLIRECMYEP